MCLLKEVVCHLPFMYSPKAPFLSLIQKNYPAFVGFPGASAVKYPPVMQELQETWVQSLGQEDPLEKGMEPTPVLLPGKFLEEPGRLQSTESQRVRHDWAIEQQQEASQGAQ